MKKYGDKKENKVIVMKTVDSKIELRMSNKGQQDSEKL